MFKIKILDRLYSEENKYIEEIDRLEKQPNQVSFVEGKENSGWLCLKTDHESFDWNMARLIGDFHNAKAGINSIPFKEYVLLVPEEQKVEFETNCKTFGKLLYYEYKAVSYEDESEGDNYRQLASEFGLGKESIRTRASFINSRIDDIYLVLQNNISGYCRLVKSTWHYGEVAIDIKAELRGQGLGTALLALMVKQFRNKRIRLSYVVEDDNLASIAIAEKNSLKKVFALDRYLISK